MGRVYNALVRAERSAGGSRPIGAPAPRHNGSDKNDQSYVSPVTSEQHRDVSSRSSQQHREPQTAKGNNGSDLREIWQAEVPTRPVRPVKAIDVRTLPVNERFNALGDPAVVEKYKTIAIRTVNALAEKGASTLLVTSAVTGDGKTTVAANLAWVLSKLSGRKVLLIAVGADEGVASFFGLSAATGWRGLIDEDTCVDDSIYHLIPGGLAVLPLHREPMLPVIAGAHAVFGELKARYDLILVDGPPLLESDGAQWLMKMCDAVMIVARARQTRGDELVAARKLIPKSKRLGVVLNDFSD